MNRFRGCLTNLQPRARRLLSLRAGLSGPARSATAVARILKISQAKEQSLEQQSLLQLQAVSITGCSGAAAGTQSASTTTGFFGLAPTPQWATATGSLASTPAGTVPAAGGRALTSAPRRTRSGHGAGHGQATVVMAPTANRGVERAGAGSSLPTAAMIPAFAALVLGLCLVALPGVRRRVLPTAGPARPSRRAGAGATAAGMTAATATGAAEVAGTAGTSGGPATTGVAAAGVRHHTEDRPATLTSDAAAAAAAAGAAAAASAGTPSSPAGTPAGANGALAQPQVQGQPEPAPGTTPRPEVPDTATVSRRVSPSSGPISPASPTPGPDSPAEGPGTSGWVREHAGQAAMVATIVAGGLARLASRGRGRGRR